MRWIDATRVLAEVVDREASSDRSHEELVRGPVGKGLFPYAPEFPVEVAIAVGSHGSDPEPAVVSRSDLGLKSLPFVSWFRPTHPTKFTELIGHQLMQHVRARAAA